MIPLIDLKSVYFDNQRDIDQAISEVLNSGWFILGPKVEQFESAFSEWLKVPHVVTVANGTDALELSLRACGIVSGDRVVTVSNTAVATVSAIERCGAIPVFCDIEPDTMTLCPDKLEQLLKETSQTIKAVIPVHLYGQMADMPSIMQLSKQYGFYVIEDCAQAHGATLLDKKAGSFGHMGTFSFYPTKNLGAFGDGGAIVTKEPECADKLKLLRQYGWRVRNNSEIAGVNSRLDEIQAALLSVLLKKLDVYTTKRQQTAMEYKKLAHDSIQCPITRQGGTHVYHQYVIRSRNRDKLQKYLTKHDIETAIHYPIPIHCQSAYVNKYELINPLPVTEHCVKEILSLPIHPYLTVEQINHVAETLSAWDPEMNI